MDGEVLNSMKTLDLETNEWRMQAQTLSVARKDHACVATRLDDEPGILVTGGVDADDKPLSSVEFFSIPKQAGFIILSPYTTEVSCLGVGDTA